MTSSYFEQLGRQELAPFTDTGVDYLETGAELVEPFKIEIDRLIQDQRSIFSTNIDAYNKAMQNRSDRFKNLELLTTKGKAVWDKRQEYVDNRDEWLKLKKIFSDPNKIAHYVTIEERAEKAQAEIDKDTQIELGKIDKTGSDSSGVKYSGEELLQLKQLIASQDFRNGTNVAKSMSLYLPMWMKLAKENLIVDGKLWADMNLTERQNWMNVAGAEFVATFGKAHPELREGQLIRHFMPTWSSTEKTWLKQGFDLESAATEKITSDSMKHNIYNGIIANTNADSNPDSMAVVSSPFTRNGWIDNRTAYYKSKGISNARERANDDWTDIIIEGIQDGVLNEENIEWLMERHKFVPEQHKDGGKKTNYFGIKPKNAARIYNAFNEQVKKDNLAIEKQRRDAILLKIKEGQHVPREVLSQFTNDDIRKSIETALNEAAKPVFDRPQFKSVQQTFYSLSQVRAGDPSVMGKENVQDAYWRTIKANDIYKQMGRYFHERYEYWLPIIGEEKAIINAQDDTIKAMERNEFDDPTTIAGSTKLAERIDKLTDTVESIGVGKYINHPEVLAGEEVALNNAEQYLAGETDKLDPYWTVVSLNWKNAGPLKVAHDRLVALKRIKPMPNFTGDIKLPIRNDLLTYKNTPERTLQAFLYTENVETMLNQLTSPDSETNGGVDAIQNDQGEWTGELPLGKPLSEHTILEVWDLVNSGYTNLGLYGFTNEALIQVIGDNLNSIDTSAKFDEQLQQDFLLARLYYKANNANQFSNSVTNYRRLLKFNKEDIEKYESIIGTLPPYQKLNTLSAVAAEEEVNNAL